MESRQDGASTNDELHVKQQKKTHPFSHSLFPQAMMPQAPQHHSWVPFPHVSQWRGGCLVFQTICHQLRWLPQLPKWAGFVQTGPFTWGGTSEGHDPCRAVLNPSETRISFSTLPIYIETKVPNQLNTQTPPPPPRPFSSSGAGCANMGYSTGGVPACPVPAPPQPPTIPPSWGRSRDVAGGLCLSLLGLDGGFLPLPSSGLKACVKGFFKRPLLMQHCPQKTQGMPWGKAVLTLAKIHRNSSSPTEHMGAVQDTRAFGVLAGQGRTLGLFSPWRWAWGGGGEEPPRPPVQPRDP